LFCESEEFRIGDEELTVRFLIQGRDSCFNELLYFEQVLAQKPNDIRWNPWITAIDDLRQMVLPNISITVSRQNAIDQVSLQTTQFANANQRGVVIDTKRDLKRLPADVNPE
jgi:hypothetical protein